ncbi:hypothetical protein LTR97_004372 [Elasticomyces elasticus]|uniref:RING-type domain-containing protein n=1 Tax=Elasticomyces elasticus TaxID=574655 RepID=A0AAN7WBS9_9PEZI|nr:hypothetical protein LTR97_004372 [Elasticomyces elasticus]
MAATSTLKRSIEEEEQGPNKKAKLSFERCCPICGTKDAKLKEPPEICHTNHDDPSERACGECWEAYLSREVERKRYDASKLGLTMQTCQARCVQSRARREDGMPELSAVNGGYVFEPQSHDRETDGRIFSCKYCSFATCVDCDRPEHCGESCIEYRRHTDMLQDLPLIRHKYKKDTIKPCPGCKVYWMLGDSACGYVTCDACLHRFCSRCLVPWVGDGSAYLLGPKAHGIDPADGKPCAYGQRDKISKYALKKRFATDEEVPKFWAGILAAKASAGAVDSIG